MTQQFSMLPSGVHLAVHCELTDRASSPLFIYWHLRHGSSCCVAGGQVGAQVMLLRNLDLTGDARALVNGSRGIVESLKPVAEVHHPQLQWPRLLPAALVLSGRR